MEDAFPRQDVKPFVRSDNFRPRAPFFIVLLIFLFSIAFTITLYRNKKEDKITKGQSFPATIVSTATPFFPATTPILTISDSASESFDRIDDISGNQIKLVYILPKDRVDRQLHTNGAIARSVNAFQKWLFRESGKRLRIDTYRGEFDIGFIRLDQTDAEIAKKDPYIRNHIEFEMEQRGLVNTNKIYAVYYDGSSKHSCGGGAWPPTIIGNVAALYMFGAPPDTPPCPSNSFAYSEDYPYYYEFAMLHEIFHSLGATAKCAPHHTLAGHVSDDPSDLMYAGDKPWKISALVLDVNNDDYWRHNDPNCLDLAKSLFFN